MKRREWVWRIPPEMLVYLRGDKDSQDQTERVRELVRLLRRLVIAGFAQAEDKLSSDRIKNVFGSRIYAIFKADLITLQSETYSELITRITIASANCNVGFCDDLAEAFRYVARHDLPDARLCLAQAYLELTRPENYQPQQPQFTDAFLKAHDGVIDTRSVRRYAEILFVIYRQAKQSPEPSSQLELFKHAPELKANWSELFQQLGLTKEYLPRTKPGRPREK